MEEKKLNDEKLEEVTGGFNNLPDDGKYDGIRQYNEHMYQIEKERQELGKK